MKKSTKILLDILLAVIFVVAVATLCFICKELNFYVNAKSECKKAIIYYQENIHLYGQGGVDMCLKNLADINASLTKYSLWLTAHLIVAIITLIIFIFVNPKLLKKETYANLFNKEARTQSKAARAEANKQARIEQLQAELDELKKD